MDLQEMGKRLRELREDAKYTQTDLGKKFGVGRDVICKYEKGARQIPLYVIEGCAKLFNVPTDYLLCVTDVSKPPTDSDETAKLRTICDYTGLPVDTVTLLHERSTNEPEPTVWRPIQYGKTINEQVFRSLCDPETVQTIERALYQVHHQVMKSGKEIDSMMQNCIIDATYDPPIIDGEPFIADAVLPSYFQDPIDMLDYSVLKAVDIIKDYLREKITKPAIDRALKKARKDYEAAVTNYEPVMNEEDAQVEDYHDFDDTDEGSNEP